MAIPDKFNIWIVEQLGGADPHNLTYVQLDWFQHDYFNKTGQSATPLQSFQLPQYTDAYRQWLTGNFPPGTDLNAMSPAQRVWYQNYYYNYFKISPTTGSIGQSLDQIIAEVNQDNQNAADAYSGSVTYTPEGQPVDANGTYTPFSTGIYDGAVYGADKVSTQDLARWLPGFGGNNAHGIRNFLLERYPSGIEEMKYVGGELWVKPVNPAEAGLGFLQQLALQNPIKWNVPKPDVGLFQGLISGGMPGLALLMPALLGPGGLFGFGADTAVAGNITQIFDDGSVLTTNAAGDAISATNAIDAAVTANNSIAQQLVNKAVEETVSSPLSKANTVKQIFDDGSTLTTLEDTGEVVSYTNAVDPSIPIGNSIADQAINKLKDAAISQGIKVATGALITGAATMYRSATGQVLPLTQQSQQNQLAQGAQTSGLQSMLPFIGIAVMLLTQNG